MPRNVAILIFDDVEVLDFAGPFEVFSVGSNKGQDFRVYTIAEQARPVRAIGGLSINPAYTIKECPAPDILIVPGGQGTRREIHNESLIAWIREIAPSTKLLLSVCTGALLLAKAGLLEGLRVTTHHNAMDALRALVPPTSQVIENVRYIDNGTTILSAGISAGIDMSLHVVSRLLGEDRARATAERMEYDWRVIV
jgi:transcriptional regulator GlxA family with amidase domain